MRKKARIAMNRNRIIQFIAVAGCIAVQLSLISCSSSDTVAGGTNIPNQVVGYLRTEAGDSVANASVSLIMAGSGERLAAVDSARSDVHGLYEFNDVDSGTYYIEAYSSDSSLAVLHAGVRVIDDSGTVELTGIMKNTGTLSGVVSITTDFEITLKLTATPFYAIPQSTGSFTFPSLPPGRYRLAAIVRNQADDTAVAAFADSVIIEAGMAAVSDTVRLMPLGAGSGDILYDDFSDGNHFHELGQTWWGFDDRNEGGNSAVTPYGTASTLIVAPGADGSGSCGHISFTFGDLNPRFVGLGSWFAFSVNGFASSRDISSVQSISFRLKGTATEMYAAFSSDLIPDSEGKFLQLAAMPSAWTDYTIDLTTDIIDTYPASDPRSWENASRFMDRLIFVAVSDSTGESGELWVDDIVIHY
jgi:hypothetical protein